MDEARIEPGYIITKANNKVVRTVNDVLDALKSAGGESTWMGFMKTTREEFPYKINLQNHVNHDYKKYTRLFFTLFYPHWFYPYGAEEVKNKTSFIVHLER